jgi:hypothetical protein
MPILSSCNFVRRTAPAAPAHHLCVQSSREPKPNGRRVQAALSGESFVEMLSSPLLGRQEVCAFVHPMARRARRSFLTGLAFPGRTQRVLRQVLVVLTWKGALPLTLTLTTPTRRQSRTRC